MDPVKIILKFCWVSCRCPKFKYLKIVQTKDVVFYKNGFSALVKVSHINLIGKSN